MEKTQSYATIAAKKNAILDQINFMAASKLTGPPALTNIYSNPKTNPNPIIHDLDNGLPRNTYHGEQKYAEIQDFTQKLVAASLVSLETAKQYLDILIARGQETSLPTCEVHYDYATLFNINRNLLLPKYPELVGLKTGQLLPKTVGPNNLNPVMTINNKRYYITPIVRKTEELGYNKIYVDSTGLFFYLNPEDLGPLAKEYFNLCEELVQASLPSLDEVKNKLEITVDHPNCAPTHGVFYSYSKLFSGKTNYPELNQLTPDEPTLPTELGPYRLQLTKIFTNKNYFIDKIVRHTKEIGFEGANVGPNGITYYLKPDQLGPKATALYQQFFLTLEELLVKANEQKDKRSFKIEKMIILTYAKTYSNPQVQRINYELRKYYNQLGYSVSLGYDWRYEIDNQRLIMKIYIDPDDFKSSVQQQVPVHVPVPVPCPGPVHVPCPGPCPGPCTVPCPGPVPVPVPVPVQPVAENTGTNQTVKFSMNYS